MRVYSVLLLLGQASAFTGVVGASATRSFASKVSMSTMHDFTVSKPDGSSMSMGDYKGKPTLVVNVASL